MKTKELSTSEWNALQMHVDAISEIIGKRPAFSTYRVKSKSKSQLAKAAGVSLDVFVDWISRSPHKEVLEGMGIQKFDRMLHPRAVIYICSEFCISID